MEKLTVDALCEMVDSVISENYEQIKHNIFCGISTDMSEGEMLTTLIMNCFSESMKRTSQLIFEVLQSAHVLQIDEKEIAKQMLKQFSSETKD